MTFEERYEPQRFSELIFADPIARATCNQYASGHPYKPLMLWGPPGTAKTTTARVIIRERYRLAGYDGDIHEFNGADMKPEGLKTLTNIGSLLEVTMGDPILLINELDEFDDKAQAKFRAWMDAHKWCKLIVTTNEQPGVNGVRQKLIPALQSRFVRVELGPPSLQDCLPRVVNILQQEGFTVSTQDVRVLLSTFNGDIRDMLPLLEEATDKLRQSHTQTSQPQPQPAKPSLTVVSAKPQK